MARKAILPMSARSQKRYCLTLAQIIRFTFIVLFVDLGAIDHVAYDKGAFVEFRQILRKTRWIYINNITKVKVKEMGVCKLVLCSGQILYLHEVLYILEIQ